MNTITITVYNVIGNKTYEDNPDCNGAYCVTCGTMKEAERALRECVESDYDAFYEGEAFYEGDDEEHNDAEETITRAIKEKYLSVGELTVIYDIRKQTITVPVPKELKALAKAAADYANAVDEEMESGDYHLDDTCKTEAEIETHNENVRIATENRKILDKLIAQYIE